MPAKENQRLRVSVIVPCLNESAHIETCLENLLNQIGVPVDYEIVVADGGSTDGSLNALEKIEQHESRIRVVSNKSGIVSAGLNKAIEVARGEIIIRADVHTEYAEDYVSQCINTLQETGADNVGGPARTRSKGFFQTANAIAFQTPFAVGGARFHDEDYAGWVDTVPYGCWWRSAFDRYGLFDEDFVRNQDDELNLRICRMGGKIWQNPSIRSWYFPRPSPGALFRQYYQYGFWKTRVIKKHGWPASFRHLVPVIAVTTGIVLGILTPFLITAAYILLALGTIYFALNLYASLRACRRAGKARMVPAVGFAIVLYHSGYGLGFVHGLIGLLLRRNAMNKFTSRLTR